MLSLWAGRPPRPCRAQVATEVERARCCGRPPANPLLRGRRRQWPRPGM